MRRATKRFGGSFCLVHIFHGTALIAVFRTSTAILYETYVLKHVLIPLNKTLSCYNFANEYKMQACMYMYMMYLGLPNHVKIGICFW